MSLLQKLFGVQKTTKDVAKDRLKMVLMSDRATIPAARMDELRRELVAVISRFVEIDEAELEFELERHEGQVAIVANIPIRRVRE